MLARFLYEKNSDVSVFPTALLSQHRSNENSVEFTFGSGKNNTSIHLEEQAGVKMGKR